MDGGPSDDPNEDPSYESDPLLAAAMRLLSKDCDAIVGLPIGAGPAVLKAAAARGSRVPADVMLAVVDEDPDWADANPPLTALSLNPIGTAIQLTDLVIDVIEGKVSAPVELFIPAHLIVRASTQR